MGGHGISLFLPWKRIQHSTFIHKITKLRIQHNTFIHKITKLRLLRQVDNVALSKLALVAFSLKGTRTQHTEILRDSAPTRQLESRAEKQEKVNVKGQSAAITQKDGFCGDGVCTCKEFQ